MASVRRLCCLALLLLAGSRGALGNVPDLDSALASAAQRYAASSVEFSDYVRSRQHHDSAAGAIQTPNGNITRARRLLTTYATIPSTFTAAPSRPWWPNNLVPPSAPSIKMAPLTPFQRVAAGYTGCPANASPRMLGADPIGVVDCSDAILNAAVGVQLLYFPLRKGRNYATYKIAKSITIVVPVAIPCGVSLQVSAGATLTLTAQPRGICPLQSSTRPPFAGEGSVKLASTAGAEVRPTWFGVHGVETFAKAMDSCRESDTACTLLLSVANGLSSTMVVPPGAGVFATNGGTLVGRFTGSPGVTIAAGSRSAARPVILAGIRQLSVGVSLAAGLSNLRFQAGSIQASTVGIEARADTASQSNNEIFIAALNQVTHGIDVIGGSGTLTDVVFRPNFITTVSGSAFRVSGSRPPGCARCGYVGQAIDPAGVSEGFVTFLNSATSGTFDGAALEVQTWLGGFKRTGGLPDGQYYQGAFSDLKGCLAVSSISSLLPSNSYSFAGGSGNRPSVPYFSSMGQVWTLQASVAAAQAAPVMTASTVAVTINTSTGWNPMVSRSYYIASPYLISSDYWGIIPLITNNGALVVDSISRAGTNVIKITLTNYGTTVIRENKSNNFGLQLAS